MTSSRDRAFLNAMSAYTDLYQKNYSSYNLKTYLRKKYGYTYQNLPFIKKEDIFENALKKIRDESARKALVLLAHFEEAEWTKPFILNKRMFPLLRGWIDGKVPLEITQHLVVVTAQIIRGLPTRTACQPVLEALHLIEVILKNTKDEIFIEKLVEALVLLRRHNIQGGAFILMKITPPSKKVTRETICHIRKILSAIDFSIWVKHYKIIRRRLLPNLSTQ